jgi:hypothetical protein
LAIEVHEIGARQHVFADAASCMLEIGPDGALKRSY